jgi:polysaccharide biosynthesis protein PslJ
MTTAEPVNLSASINQPGKPAGGPRSDRTPWLLCILCLLVPIIPTDVILPGALKGNGSPARMVALVLSGLVVLGFLITQRTAPKRRISPGAMILCLYFLLLLTTYAAGLLNYDDYVVATARTRSMVGLIAHVGIALYILGRVHTARQRDLLLGFLAIGLAYACLVGFLQGAASIDLRYFFQPPGFIINPESLLDTGYRLGVKRVWGTSGHPIEFSVLAAVTVPLTIYFARNGATKKVRRLSGTACCLALLALPAAVSRSGVISLIAVLAVYMFAFKVRPIATAVVAGSIAIGGYILAFPLTANALWNTITGSGEDESVEGRIDDLPRVSLLVRERPVFGLGFGGSPPAAFGYLDNQWLQAIVQGGFVGLVAMIVFTAGVIFGIAAALRRATSQREREQAYLLGGMAAGILASSTTFDLFGFEQATLILFIVYALLWSSFIVPVPELDEHLPDQTGPRVLAQWHHTWDRLVSSRSQATLLCAARHRAARAIPR